MSAAAIELVPLSSSGPPAFDCGAAVQNEFLAMHAQAGQNDGVSATHLAFHGDECVGYVTLAMGTVRFEPHERPTGATVSTLPALLVAQLAVSINARRQGIGDWLLRFAAGVAQSMRHQVGCRFLIVDCDAPLVSFYRRYGFAESTAEKRRRKAAAKASSVLPDEQPRRLFKDLFADKWLEADVAPPHLRMSELHRAAADGDLPMLKALLGAGVSPELPMGRGDDGMSWGAKPLHVAIARGALAAIDVLLAAGAKVNAIDGDCETPLHWAVRHANADAVRLLLLREAHPSLEGGNAGFTPLDYAVHQNLNEIADILRDAGGTHSEEYSREIAGASGRDPSGAA